MRESKKNVVESNSFIKGVNKIAKTLLLSTPETFEDAVNTALQEMLNLVRVDRTYIWKNKVIDGVIYTTQIYEYSPDIFEVQGGEIAVDIPISEMTPELVEQFLQNKAVNGIVKNMSEGARQQLEPQGIISIILSPIFINNEFWGFVGFDDCQKERIFTNDEEDFIKSASLLIASSIIRNEMEKELIEAKEKAFRASLVKSEFLASTSHELRTPLNAINGLTELELRKPHDLDTAINLEKIYSSGILLLKTINGLLDVSKIENEKVSLEIDSYEFSQAIKDAVEISITLSRNKKVRFELEVDSNIPQKLSGDEVQIKHILNNLLSNAFKYTEQGLIKLQIYGEWNTQKNIFYLIFKVSDTGIGMKRKQIANLFERYVRSNDRKVRSVEGTGLGLSICKKLVEMMDGEISVESEYGHGSVFTVKIRQDVIDKNPIGATTAEKLNTLAFIVEKHDSKIKQIDFVPMPYGRVLLVDDVQTNIDVAAGMMNLYNLQIDICLCGKDAVEKIKNGEKYDILFIDHMMPEMDGIECVRIIRNEIDSDYAKNVPIIALTANAISGNEKMFLENGFDVFMSKPIVSTDLDAVLKKYIYEKTDEETRRKVEEEYKNAKKTEPACEIPEIKIYGIDINEGMTRFGNNYKNYLKVLESFCTKIPEQVETVKNPTLENLPSYVITIHGIKGSCYGISANECGSIAQTLEVSAKAGNLDKVLELNGEFLEKIEKTINDIRKLLNAEAAKSAENDNRETLPKPDDKILQEILQAAETYDINEISDKLAELEKFKYETGSDLIEKLKTQVANFNYDGICEELKTFC